MYSMKEACTLTNMTYENLKFYCNEGLVPNVKRDRRNYRVFDEHDIKLDSESELPEKLWNEHCRDEAISCFVHGGRRHNSGT